jgi:hypothetical protein
MRLSHFLTIFAAAIAATPALSHPLTRRSSELAGRNFDLSPEEHFQDVLVRALDELYVFLRY